ncbi:PREDICTED: uncharacterized protein LOC107328294 [Acropora digitifera]|uniref:uncharacterized protein LOC107328294 n=1 Tax=Acropora digitifera TaxID=70779 RepID=UPI00077A08FB|nr:PREDICTED: uncharacterized protein LOC107328294 [Acropora digitifera]
MSAEKKWRSARFSQAMSEALVQAYAKHKVKRRWDDITGAVKKKEREARNKELKRLRVTGNGHMADEDDDQPNPCVETVNAAEKEIAHILGPQTFTGIPGGHDSVAILGQISKENKSEGSMEADMQDSKNSAQADNQLGKTRKKPAPKTLAQAQLEVKLLT